MKLSVRISKIASLIPNNTIVSDVGSDHCYLLIYLATNDKIQHGYAIENKHDPLFLSEKNVNQNAIKDKITLIFNDGIDNLDYKNDVIVISGLGTITISKILSKNYEWYQKQKLILCPSDFNETYELRIFLHANNFIIINEYLVYENDYHYIIFESQYQENYSQENLTDQEIYIGKYLNKNIPELINFYNTQLDIMEKSYNYNQHHHKKVIEINKIIKYNNM